MIAQININTVQKFDFCSVLVPDNIKNQINIQLDRNMTFILLASLQMF